MSPCLESGRCPGINSFAVYYGQGREDELALFDLAVVDPGWQRGPLLGRLQREKTLVIAYLSALEVSSHGRASSGIRRQDRLLAKAAPLTSTVNDNWIMDPGAPRWRKSVLAAAGELMSEGYDGIFLDTLGDVEDNRIPVGCRQELLLNAAHLVRALRMQLPHALLIQNSGLGGLYQLTARLVDFFCWENPEITPPTREVLSRAGDLAQIRWHYGTNTMILLERRRLPDAGGDLASLALARDFASQHGFVFYVAPGGYMEGVTTPG